MGAAAHDRIVLDPAVLAGKPAIRDSRLSVDFIVGLLADEWKCAGLPGVRSRSTAGRSHMRAKPRHPYRSEAEWRDLLIDICRPEEVPCILESL